MSKAIVLVGCAVYLRFLLMPSLTGFHTLAVYRQSILLMLNGLPLSQLPLTETTCCTKFPNFKCVASSKLVLYQFSLSAKVYICSQNSGQLHATNGNPPMFLIYARLFLPTRFLTVFLTLTCTELDKFRYKLHVITSQLLSLLEISKTLVGLLTFSFGFLLYLRISKVPCKAVQIRTNLALEVFPDGIEIASSRSTFEPVLRK